MRLFFIIALFTFMSSGFAISGGVRLKDLADFDGVRENDLVGYGLVVGLNGTGDGIRNSPFTEEIMTNILERLGVNLLGEQIRPKNVAAVIVTAELPEFSRVGSKLDVTISAIGDATSLQGGTLIMTPLNAADGQIYAVAQGTVVSGGVAAKGIAASVVEGVPTSGSIPSGAKVEREVAFSFRSMKNMRIVLREADFSTAVDVEKKINLKLGRPIASVMDSRSINLNVSSLENSSLPKLLASIENIMVVPDQVARVVVDQRSGTIVIGAEVKISRVAVSQGGITLKVQEQPLAVQPNPFSNGKSVIIPRTSAEINKEQSGGLAEISGGSNLSEIVSGLNALGVAPIDMINILKSIKAAGALHAEFLVR